MNPLNKYFFLLIFLLPSLAMALNTDSKAPASISADSATINRHTGSNTFIGNVVIIQGSTKITANKIITFTNQQNKIIKAIAYGTPAHYQTLPNKKQKIFYARANTIEYYPPKHLVVLIGNGHMQQGNNSLSGPRIEYNSQTGQLKSAPVKGKRTTIILEPQQKEATS